MTRTLKYFLVFMFLASCSGFSDAAKVLRNEKKSSTDEFFVKQRQPLTLPPEYDTLPKPKSIEDLNKNAKGEQIEEIIKITKEKETNNKNFKSVEDSILNKISK